MHRHRPYYIPPLGNLARLFVGLGHQVTALTQALPDGGEGRFEDEGIEVHYLRGTGPGRPIAGFWRSSAARFDQLHSERGFDLVFGRGNATWGYFRLSRFAGQVPVISHEGTYPRWMHQIETRSQRLGAWLSPPLALALAPVQRQMRLSRRLADRVVGNSAALAGALARADWWHPPRTTFIPYGFETEGYEPVAATDPPRLAYLGRLARDKGLFTLIDMLARLSRKDVTVEAIGPGSERFRAALAARAAARGLAERFRMPGPVPHGEVGPRLAGAAVFVFASTHHEGLPKVVMGAMAAGLPVVAFALPGMDTLVVDGVTGHLVRPRDGAGFTARVEALLADPAAAARMGAAGRRRIETEFAPAAIAARWDALLREVAGGAGPD